MKARNEAAVAALRSVLGAIDNAEAVAVPEGRAPMDGVIAGAVHGLGAGEAPRLDLSEAQVTAIVRAETADARAAAADYERLGQSEQAARLTSQADVLAALLGEP